MLRFIASLFIVAVVVTCSGCGSADVKAVLDDLQADCVRHYNGSLASGIPAPSGSLTFTIDCKPTNVVNSEAAVINANTAADNQKIIQTQALIKGTPVPEFHQPSTVIIASPPDPTKQAPAKTVLPPPDH
jgi:hypothetical protein